MAELLRLAGTLNSGEPSSTPRSIPGPEQTEHNTLVTLPASHSHALPSALATLTVLSASSRCILERHLAEDYAVRLFICAEFEQCILSKKCVRTEMVSKRVALNSNDNNDAESVSAA